MSNYEPPFVSGTTRLKIFARIFALFCFDVYVLQKACVARSACRHTVLSNGPVRKRTVTVVWQRSTLESSVIWCGPQHGVDTDIERSLVL